ncbi:hypothetical protein NDU88_005849 [Pleurodeles waltl]|uniref:Uncharacterized protein n=1 Tax=Pleurodeles waltl TaxID=8319 RepID=A0AAV7ME72_PLEWA|nr:hypothetical protein NDU88_005849 [Pleurodeles waltl]
MIRAAPRNERSVFQSPRAQGEQKTDGAPRTPNGGRSEYIDGVRQNGVDWVISGPRGKSGKTEGGRGDSLQKTSHTQMADAQRTRGERT